MEFPKIYIPAGRILSGLMVLCLSVGMLLALPSPGRTETKGLYALPFHTTRVRVDDFAEMEMLSLVNKERAAHGLSPLLLDDRLRAAARAHARDMFARGYFDHVSPEGRTFDQRIDAVGVQYFVSGENIALTQTVHGAHKSLMASPGHRANILNPDYQHIGIGVIDAGQYGLMFAQEFTD